MTNYQETTAKLKNTQLNRLKSAAKSKIGTTLRVTKKIFEVEELSYELFLRTMLKLK